MPEVVSLLSGRRVVVDATVGTGGHSEALLEAGVGRVIGVDRDREALDEAARRLEPFGERFRPVEARFSLLAGAVREAGAEEVGGVLYDLGVSSLQLDRSERGFSYRGEGHLDMRMGQGDGLTAAEVVNTYPEDRLARLIFDYGGERHSRRIAGAVVRARQRAPISTTRELAAIVAGAVPRRRGGAHPARRTFQAIRIEVNAELEELTVSLPQAVDLLEPGGRLVIISYHSLEDRTAKRFLQAEAGLVTLTRKPTRPGPQEVASNPRARSARLRAAERKAAA